MSDTQNTTEETAQETPPGLSVGDLTQVVQVLQVVSQRGAFRADELTSVGGLYDRLVAFLEATGAVTRVDPNQEKAEGDKETAKE